nr:hypothetical protein [Ornithinimicrobium sp. HY1793]
MTYRPPTGSFPVGVRDGELVDTTYPVLRTEDAEGRRIMVRAWHPAAEDGGARRPYLVGEEAQLVQWCLGLAGAPSDWAGQLGAVETFSQPDTPVAPGTFPTVVFSHGATSWVSQNTPLMEHLASHGYVVWSVTHPGESSGVQFADGSTVRHDEAFQEAFLGIVGTPDYIGKFTGDVAHRHAATPGLLDDLGMGPWARRWVDDHRAVIDAIEQDSIDGEAGALVTSSDLGALGVVGMSFGGAAAASTAQVDERVRAAVNLDGGQFLSDLLGVDARVPLLHVSTDAAAALAAVGVPGATLLETNEFFYEEHTRAGLHEHVHRLRVAAATHMELTDFVLLPQDERSTVIPDGGTVESQRVIDLLNATVGAFLDQALRGEDRDFPASVLHEFPELSPVDLSPIRDWARGEQGVGGA